jgi:hypothetical protein
MRVRAIINGDVSWGHGKADYLTGSAATAQKVRCRLLVIMGEWYLDNGIGVPYFPIDQSGAKTFATMPADLVFLESTLKSTILQTTGVQDLLSFSTDFDHKTRECTCNAQITTTDGDVQNITVTYGATMPTTTLNWTQNYHKMISVDGTDPAQSLLELDLSDIPPSCTVMDIIMHLVGGSGATGSIVGQLWINDEVSNPESFSLALGTATTLWQESKFSLPVTGPGGSGMGNFLLDSVAGFTGDVGGSIATNLSPTIRISNLKVYTSYSGGGLSPVAAMAPGSYLSVIAR